MFEFNCESPVAMQAVQITGYGGRDRLEHRDIEKPAPGPTEVLLQVKAASLNPLDWKLRSGMLKWVWPLKFPFTPGFDVAGTIVAVGGQVSRFQPGDAVFAGLATGGGHAEYAVVNESLCVRKPEGLSFDDAAAIPVAAMSALQALRNVSGVEAGSHVLINGASGGVGTFAVQIAAALACRVTGVTSTGNIELVQSLGADDVIDYTQEDVFRAKPYDCFFDVVPNRSFGECSGALTRGGVYVTTLPGPGPLLWKVITRIGRLFGYRRRCGWLILKPNGQDLEFIAGLVDQGRLRPVVDSTYSLSDIRNAHEQIETGHTRGKIVIRIP